MTSTFESSNNSDYKRSFRISLSDCVVILGILETYFLFGKYDNNLRHIIV